jgi:broad specificity phosphatase PhoE
MKPKRIILIRHGQSQGNADLSTYTHTPDYAIRLTEKGVKQATDAGHRIDTLIQGETYGCYYSPYFRARQTMEEAIKGIGSACSFKKEEPRIREQEYAGKLRSDRHDFDKEREAYGKFFYRMDGGESGADVYDRVSDFIGAMHRDFEKKDYPENCLLSAHGMTNRIFIMKWTHATVEEFEMWKNPRNGELYILELNTKNHYDLITEIPKHPKGYGHQYEKA